MHSLHYALRIRYCENKSVLFLFVYFEDLQQPWSNKYNVNNKRSDESHGMANSRSLIDISSSLSSSRCSIIAKVLIGHIFSHNLILLSRVHFALNVITPIVPTLTFI